MFYGKIIIFYFNYGNSLNQGCGAGAKALFVRSEPEPGARARPTSPAPT